MRYAPGQNIRSRSRIVRSDPGTLERKQMRCFMMQSGHVALAEVLRKVFPRRRRLPRRDGRVYGYHVEPAADFARRACRLTQTMKSQQDRLGEKPSVSSIVILNNGEASHDLAELCTARGNFRRSL